MNIVATYAMGSFDNSSPDKLARSRAIRYGKLLSVVRTLLENELSVWIDGNFPERRLREDVWGLARTFGVTDAVALKCVCTVPRMLEERFAERRADPLQPDALAAEIGAYWGSVAQFEAIDAVELAGFERAEILVFDSCGCALGESPASPLGIEIERSLTHAGYLGERARSARSSTD